MQRGVQDLTPDSEVRDPWPERRGSTEASRRGAAVVTPTPSCSTSTATSTRSSPTGHSKDPSAQSLPATTTARGNYSTTRIAGQRRISLPSITESPSSPNIPAAPRQSCDFGRTPQSTEPLVRTTSSLRSTNSQPTRNNPNNLTFSSRPSMDVSRPSMDVSRPSMDMSRPSMDMSRPPVDMSRPSMDNHRRQEPARRGMQRSHTTQDGKQQEKSLEESGETPAMKRRKSMESAKFLSPHSAMTSVSRRKSFDQLSSLRNSDSTSRRSSDASSTASQKTGSSATSGTTNTSMSEHTPESVSASVASGYRQQLNGSEIKALYLSGRTDSGNASMLPSPLTRSISQPVIEQVKLKRPPVSFASEPVVRQSLDLQRLAMNQERASESERLNGQLRNDSDSDLPGQLFRRRTMQDPTLNPSRLLILPRHHTMGPSGHMETRSTPTTPDEMPGSGKGSHYQQQQQHHTLSSSQDSSKSLQDIAAPRLSTSSISSLSGSSTVGRFSRMWSSSANNAAVGGKDNNAPNAVVGNWSAGEFGEASAEAAAQSLVRPELTRTRGGGGGGMLNRLSGIWSRR
ncbi:hypothetical protein BG015_010487 [Linnemannia schmuckeri]|uniref:Uncharacterized protein n=1 Tax=Linnemannia schmuckeri TaxID=64567 RepID=A0A9P5RTZ8_9FUNG|nr:hypothetical protein BG015_010487 [Linnemannia schmuckeri]